ncbi:TRAP-type C4-dicarboxylate transport system permease small subunit [Tissierella praeacuta]|uniref:TRAP transporter small permease n=1 Tax=Tissierella praeacuta TaxID=43131 RepID=UPI00105344D8|nr:TRAP transporter small permease [Tissierella praeacuta]TCU74053.1 TRAP-type C4-dicarboxylate transport system permease small subunit [Tissierella praeacuta]
MNDFFNKTISKIEETILSYTVIIMAIMLIVGVFMRAVLNSSLTFTEEIAQALLIVISFFGLEYCARKGRHITMSIVFDMVNNKYKKIFMYIISLFSSIAMTYFSYLAFKYVLSVKGLGRVTPALQIPIYLIYSVVPLGFLLGAIEYIRTLILNIKNRDLYLTSEIKVEIDKEIHRDLNNLIDEITENQGKEEV